MCCPIGDFIHTHQKERYSRLMASNNVILYCPSFLHYISEKTNKLETLVTARLISPKFKGVTTEKVQVAEL